MEKPRRVKAKIVRTVTEISIVILDKDGCIEEVEDVCETLDFDDSDVLEIITVLTIHD